MSNLLLYFEISRKLGLREEVIESAKHFVRTSHI